MSLIRKIKVIKSICLRTYCSPARLTIVSHENGVRKITLNNPAKRNALSLAMIQSLKQDVFDNIDDINLRCIILESKGPVFSSGHDLKELLQSNQKRREDIFNNCSELMINLQKVPVPVIAVVNGLAAAAGCQLIASCDITLASTKSQFSTPGASVGLFCSTPGIAVSRNVPLKVASYMLFTGNNLNAHEALQCGLVSKILEEKELDKLVEDVVESIQSKSRHVLAVGKKFFYEQMKLNLDVAYSYGSQVMVKNLSDQDAEEGINAFFSKKPPKWHHS